LKKQQKNPINFTHLWPWCCPRHDLFIHTIDPLTVILHNQSHSYLVQECTLFCCYAVTFSILTKNIDIQTILNGTAVRMNVCRLKHYFRP